MVSILNKVEKPARLDDLQILALRLKHRATILQLARQDLEETYPKDSKTGEKFVTDEVVQATADLTLVKEFGRTDSEHHLRVRTAKNQFGHLDPVEGRIKQKIEDASARNYLGKIRTLSKVYGSAERVRYAFRGLKV